MDEKTKELVEQLEAMAAERVEFDAWYVVRELVPQICAIVREQDKRLAEERRTWASHCSSWALFQKEPDTWLPYVESSLKELAEMGVPASTINSLTPFPDAASRINADNAMVYSLATTQLRCCMSDLSEECWCAGWLTGTEFALWEFVMNGPGEWGQGSIAQSDVDELKTLSRLCKGWFVWDDEQGEKFVPMMEWLEMFEEWERGNAKTRSE